MFFSSQPEYMRLIEMVDGTRIWMHKDRIQNYIGKPGQMLNFIDVTETMNLEKGEAPQSKLLPNQPTQQTTIKPLCSKIDSESQAQITRTVTHLQSYRTRGANTDTGVQAANWLRDQFQAVINSLPEERKRLFTVRLYPHTNFRQPSVIATLRGSSTELVILGSHEDSTASGGIAPGADDDASGASSVLEAFRIIANSNYVPTKTVEFHCYAAEEMGLLGSRAIANAYKAANARVFGMMQLDMTGYNPRNTNRIGIVTNGVDAPLTEFSRKLVTAYLAIGFINRTLLGGSSDHASWRAAGYRACFPFEAVQNPNIHTVRDTLSILDMKNAIEWIKLGVSFVIELSHN